MKNSFPDDDICSIKDLYGGNENLSIFYPYQFICNEEIANSKKGKICTYQLDRGNLLKNATTGTIYHKDIPLYTFFDKDQTLILHKIMKNHEIIDVISGEIDSLAGIIILKWSDNVPAGKSTIITSYEYSLECQMPKPIECPNCKEKFYNPPLDNKDDTCSLQNLANSSGNLDLY